MRKSHITSVAHYVHTSPNTANNSRHHITHSKTIITDIAIAHDVLHIVKLILLKIICIIFVMPLDMRIIL